MTDKIFERFLRGEPAAIDGIVLAYRNPLIKYGLKWTSRRDVAEDAAMEALCLLPEKASEFKDATHVKKFLHKTVWNKCQAATREIGRITLLADKAGDMPDTDAIASADIQESDIHSQWISEVIKANLPELPQKRRQDFHGYFFESKSFEDIAEERGTSVDTVRQNVRYAIKEMRKYLINKGYPGIFEES